VFREALLVESLVTLSQDRREPYPPATKCAHDFATGAGFDAIDLASSRAREITPSPSRDSMSGGIAGSRRDGATAPLLVEEVMQLIGSRVRKSLRSQ
jgi:hypothetical protein